MGCFVSDKDLCQTRVRNIKCLILCFNRGLSLSFYDAQKNEVFRSGIF